MAKVTSSVKRVEIQGDIVLTLSPIEAIVLRSLLGSCPANHKHTNVIYAALAGAGVPHIREYTPITTERIEFIPQDDLWVKDALKNWKPKS
jgi:hypothetical protein